MAAMLALVVAALAPTASGDPGAPSPAQGDLVIHKFVGSPVSGAGDGTPLGASELEGLVPVNGVVFDLYEIGGPFDAPANSEWPLVPPAGTGVSYVLATNLLQVYKGETLIGQYQVSPADTPRVTTVNGVATAEDLPQGIYLVVENAAASTNITNPDGESLSLSQVSAPFVVAVPMTNPDGDGWLDVVHVYPKSGSMTVNKQVDISGAVEVGDVVGYTITASIPGDIVGSEKFDITDQLDEALDADVLSVAVMSVPSNIVATTDYKVTYEDRLLTISFTEDGRNKLIASTHVVVVFNTTVNASILQRLDMSIENRAKAEFTNKDGADFVAGSNGGDPTTIHTASIKVTKVDQAGNELGGATFKIASDQDNAKAGHYLRLDPVSNKLVDYDPAPGSTWQNLGESNDYAISPDNADSFTGLRDFVVDQSSRVWQTYWVVETAAPSGYNMLADPIMVSFESAFDQFDDPEDYNHVYELEVVNSTGFVLPQTGGVGTMIWTVVGVVLIGLAVLVVVSKRKKEVG